MGTAAATSEDAKTVFEDKVRQLENTIAFFEKKTTALEQENNRLQERLRLALFRQFGRRAEQSAGEKRSPLFDAAETAAPAAPEAADETETVKSYNRAKRGRKPIDPSVPRVDEIIDLSEAEKQCACGSPLVCVGEDATERLIFVPEQVYAVRYHVKKYACHECEGSGDEDKPAVRTGRFPRASCRGA